ncbi:MAG: hypothetical protein IIY55_11360 [Blautia sp.]|nr:hypothetical protein [Blautia sp.]
MNKKGPNEIIYGTLLECVDEVWKKLQQYRNRIFLDFDFAKAGDNYAEAYLAMDAVKWYACRGMKDPIGSLTHIVCFGECKKETDSVMILDTTKEADKEAFIRNIQNMIPGLLREDYVVFSFANDIIY